MRAKILIVTIALSFILPVAYTFLTNAKTTRQAIEESVNSVKNEPLESVQYLVPVTNFTSLKTHLSTEELKKQKLFSLETNKSIIPTDLKVEYVSQININPDDIYLLTPDQVTMQHKTLILDGENFWSSHTDLSKWPIRSETMEINNNEKFNKEKTTTIFVSGEIIPARAVDRLGLNKYNNYTYLYDYFATDIQSADLAIGMLENAILGDPTPCTGCMLFRSDDRVAKGLADTGFDFLSTAGNHAGDAGQEAYANTIKKFDEVKIQTTGTGNTAEFVESTETKKSIWQPAIQEIKGKRIGMVAADDVAFYYWKQNESSTNYGTNYFSYRTDSGMLAIDQMQIEKFKSLKSHHNIDYLIVYMSWGVEYTNYATPHQTQLAHTLIDSGADLILASHPHSVQNIEFYNDKPVFYALGNFIFDQTHKLDTRQGINLNLYMYDDKIKSIEIMPHQVCGYHQTKNDLTQKYLDAQITAENVYNTPESEGCVYWQPKKLKPDHPGYDQILNRTFEHTKVLN